MYPLGQLSITVANGLGELLSSSAVIPSQLSPTPRRGPRALTEEGFAATSGPTTVLPTGPGRGRERLGLGLAMPLVPSEPVGFRQLVTGVLIGSAPASDQTCRVVPNSPVSKLTLTSKELWPRS